MTTETSEKMHPASSALATSVRIVRAKERGGSELIFAFLENKPLNTPPKPITQTYLQATLGNRFRGTPAFTAYAEDPNLSRCATAMFAAIRSGGDTTKALAAIERFVQLAERFATMPSTKL